MGFSSCEAECDRPGNVFPAGAVYGCGIQLLAGSGFFLSFVQLVE